MEKAIRKHEIDMTEGAIFKKMVAFAMPLLFAGVLQLLFNAADVIVVGKFAGDDSLAAVGSTLSYTMLLVNFFVGLSVGSNVLAARYYGAKDNINVSKTVHTAIAISIIGGVVLTVIGFFLSRPMMILMNSPVLDLATLYLKTYFLGMPGLLIYNFGSALLRAKGDTKRPLYYLIIAGVVNVCLNLLFVIKFNMDVAGVGIATSISYYVSATLIIITLAREDDAFKLNIKNFKVSKTQFIQIIKVGLPAGLQGVMFSISNMIIQSSINEFGKIVVAGNSAAQSIEGFVYISMNAFYQAGMSFTSQNVGAGKFDRVPKVNRTATLCVTTIGVVFGVSAYIFSGPLASIYTDTAEAIYYAGVRLLIISVPYFLCGIMDTITGVIRGLGHSLMPMIVTLIGVCVFRIIWVYTVFQIPEFHIVECVYISYPISWTLTTIVHYICYRRIMKKEHGI